VNNEHARRRDADNVLGRAARRSFNCPGQFSAISCTVSNETPPRLSLLTSWRSSHGFPHIDLHAATSFATAPEIAAYLQAVDQGLARDPEKFLADHADIASELSSFLANQAELSRTKRKSAADDSTPQGQGAERLPVISAVEHNEQTLVFRETEKRPAQDGARDAPPRHKRLPALSPPPHHRAESVAIESKRYWARGAPDIALRIKRIGVK
jgi:hypothetical protein